MVKEVIKLGATWCQPCKAFTPIFERVANDEKYKGIVFKNLDVEDDDEGVKMSEKYMIRSVPTTIILDESMNPITKIMGATTESSFRDALDEAMKQSA